MFDHAKRAQQILAEGVEAVQKAKAAEPVFPDAADAYGKKAMGCWAQAQVHATLALMQSVNGLTSVMEERG